jgi:acyl-CoA thioester hydrolase
LARFALTVRVYYEDTDAAGVVYYAGYLRFMERARTEWLESLGFPLAGFEREHGVTFAVRRAEIDFLKPARLDDRLAVSVLPAPGEERRRASRHAKRAEAGTRDTRLGWMSACRLVIGQDVRRNDELLVAARITLACLDPVRWRPARIPAPLARVLAPPATPIE